MREFMATIAETIGSKREAILQSWVAATERIASAHGLSQAVRVNILPLYLVSLASPEAAAQERRLLLESHVSGRIRMGFQIDDVIEELVILGRSVEEACGEGVEIAQISGLFEVLRQDSVTAAALFRQHLEEDEQEEKLYLRRLQALAIEALHAPVQCFEKRLRDALEILMEGTRTQTAAMLLYDVERRDLWTAASVGVAEEPMASFALGDAALSFVAAVASAEGGLARELLDVEVTELHVSETLRHSGIRSVLGVRLPARHTLMGVVYVGLVERRRFTAREVRRLETLAEQLSVHLDAARLFAELRRTITELQLERELRERFISVLAHDLRGPLSVVRTCVHLLGAADVDLGPFRDVHARAARNLQRADRMVEDLLDVLRIRAGRGMPLSLAECDLAAVAREVVAESSSPRVVLAGDASVRGVWSADALSRALWNLVTNALKYGAPDGAVTVTARSCDEGAELSVHNDGSPIAPEEQRRLFEPFSQLASGASGASGERKGWGLGLTIVKACAEAHGGRVELESDAARGTTFTVKLPRDASSFQPAA